MSVKVYIWLHVTENLAAVLQPKGRYFSAITNSLRAASLGLEQRFRDLVRNLTSPGSLLCHLQCLPLELIILFWLLHVWTFRLHSKQKEAKRTKTNSFIPTESVFFRTQEDERFM